MAASLVNWSWAWNYDLSDTASLNINVPSGTVEGDFMVAIVSTWAGATVSAPGWTVETYATTTNLSSWILTKVAGASEPSSYVFSWSGAASANGGIITYADTDGFAPVSGGANPAPKTTGGSIYITPPVTGAASVDGVGTVLGAWHDTGGTGVTCTGPGTELWDVSATDGSPSTHERGSAAYGAFSVSSGSTFGGSSYRMTPSSTILQSIAWAWIIGDRVATPSGSGSSSLGGVTSSGSASASSTPTGAGTSSLSPVASSGSGREWLSGVGSSALSGAVSSGLGAMQPRGSGSSVLGGVTSSGTSGVEGTKLELRVGGEWVDITPSLRHSAGVTITRGRSSSGSQTVTSSCSFRLDNRNEQFNPFNPNGVYYGYLNRNTEIRMTKQEVGVRFWGEIASFDFGTDLSGNDLFVDVECAGLLRRLEQGKGATSSAIQREILAQAVDFDLMHYWPMEEGGGHSFADAAPVVSHAQINAPRPPLRIDQVGEGFIQFGQYRDFVCSAPLPQIGSSRFASPKIAGNLVDELSVTCLFATPGGMAAGADILRVTGTDADGYALQVDVIYATTNTFRLAIAGWSSGMPYSASVTGEFTVVGRPGCMLEVYFLGDDVYLYAQDVERGSRELVASLLNYMHATGDYAIEVNPYNRPFNNASSAYIGHIAVWDGGAPAWTSLDAHRGEAAATRFLRLCAEEGVAASVSASASKRMGYQGPKTFVQLLRECEATDGGVMFESRDELGLAYRTVASQYNQSAALALDFEGGHLLNQFKPSYDDQDVFNDVTVTRQGGGVARYEITDGRMSTAASPDGIGRYDTSVTLSLARDEDAYPQAGWRAFKGSLDEIKVSRLSTGLEVPAVAADDALTVQVLTVDLGDRVTVANCPPWLSLRDDVLDQILDGYTERWDQTEHRWTYNTSPAKPYSVAQAGTSLRVAPSGRSFLLDGIDADDTTVNVVTYIDGRADDDLLQWSVADGPFDINVGGERMTVTAVAYVGHFGASFHGAEWALTVTRSLAKTHESGTGVQLWNRPRVAL
ncbi:hypothetical protein [Streptomyces sp. NBC_00525]|uniref:hypothetical protein n=1 Tax=Streptomyces sp. NBC_00525 TaxID=2903660 RepID=UPI002E806E23|nr:hypothetical protein [Streptomyces sp. NBC_00525]WUC97422.1 hypothetical protein OG710_29080 [Streptomyces sp. NBC_00525]